MLSILLDYKWQILIVSETTAWIATFYMLYARYWLNSSLQFYLTGAVAIVTGYFPHIIIGILNYIHFQKLDTFTLVIILLFLFAFTFGKKVVLKMDKGIQNWVNHKRKIEKI
ncbi:hypothetical protein R4Z09_26080 [Niallia oryzisoli]|uniref:Uncharacterized protein n=1 Tax=Niallia oryzisoli TaxID=1737571 RepID=A0ABZ2CAD1_9BACI